MKDKVSIIVPVHNSAAYIENCIGSLMQQTYLNIEVLLVENGSTDQSYHICQTYEKADSRIRAFHLDESGVSHARNYGMQNASGKYIAFADSDDYCERDWCLRLIEAEEEGKHIYFPLCGYRKVRGYCQEILQGYYYEDREISRIELADILAVHDKALLNTPCNKLYQKSIIIEFGLGMPEDLSLGEDLVFNLSYLEVCGRKGFIIQNQLLYNYVRDGKESLDNGYREDYHYTVQRMYDAFYGFCIRKNIMINELFWKWAMWMYREALNNTNSEDNKQNIWKRYKINDRVMKDWRLTEIIKQIGQGNGMPAYVGYRSKSYAVLLLMQFYEKCKTNCKERWRNNG